MRSFILQSIDVSVYRAPIERPVQTAFGRMTDRPAVIIHVIEQDGSEGFGEVWCNFPPGGAEHRKRLVTNVLSPLVIGRCWNAPSDLFRELSEQLRKLALQSGEPGPIAQAIAGLDIAIWDMMARREGKPLFRMLNGDASGRMPTYASGINPDDALQQARRAQADGHQTFKLKVGFERDRDLLNLETLRAELGDDATIMVDANQAWEFNQAIEMSALMAPYRPAWLEEPLLADTPIDVWRALAKASPIPLAAGENLRGQADFDTAIESGAFAVIQPDVAKWGGLSAGFPLAQRILAVGLRYCPHYLGAGVGLLASAHLLAAAGGGGMLEVDSNPNPLREGLAKPFPLLDKGTMTLSEAPGLGILPDPSTRRFLVET